MTITAQDGTRAALVGSENLYTAIDLAGAHHLRIEGIEIRSDTAQAASGGLRDGISGVGAPLSDVVLCDLRIHHLDEFGVNLQDAYNVRIETCEISYCGFGAVGGPSGEQGGWRRVIISDTTLSYSGHYYRGGDGADRPYDRPDGLGSEASAGPLTVVSCTAAHNRGDGLDSKCGDTLIERCIVANNNCDGVKLWAGDSRVVDTLIYGRGDGDDEVTPWAALVIDGETPGQHYELINVTVHDALGGNYLAYVQYDHPATATTLALHNCILSGEGPSCPLFVAAGTTLTVAHTLLYLPQCDEVLQHGEAAYDRDTITAFGDGVIYGDPLFVATAWGAEGDYTLLAQSPAIDHGDDAWAPPLDLSGAPRLGRADMGAYEWRPQEALWLILPLIMAH